MQHTESSKGIVNHPILGQYGNLQSCVYGMSGKRPEKTLLVCSCNSRDVKLVLRQLSATTIYCNPTFVKGGIAKIELSKCANAE